MTEIIFRKIELPMVQNLAGKRVQVSYNDNKHLAVRFFNKKEEDMIIVFDENTTAQIINFIRENIK